jgi:hypothetical protein
MLNNKLSRLSLINLPSFVRHQTNIARDNKKGKSSTEHTLGDRHLANITVTSFYSQSAIEQLAQKVLSFHSILIIIEIV